MATKAPKAPKASVPPVPVTETKVPPTPSRFDRLRNATEKRVKQNVSEAWVAGLETAIPTDDSHAEKAIIGRHEIITRLSLLSVSVRAREIALAHMTADGLPKRYAMDVIRSFVSKHEAAFIIPGEKRDKTIPGSLPFAFASTAYGVTLKRFGSLHSAMLTHDGVRPINVGMSLLDACEAIKKAIK